MVLLGDDDPGGKEGMVFSMSCCCGNVREIDEEDDVTEDGVTTFGVGDRDTLAADDDDDLLEGDVDCVDRLIILCGLSVVFVSLFQDRDPVIFLGSKKKFF